MCVVPVFLQIVWLASRLRAGHSREIPVSLNVWKSFQTSAHLVSSLIEFKSCAEILRTTIGMVFGIFETNETPPDFR
jgi:hypothetical protein